MLHFGKITCILLLLFYHTQPSFLIHLSFLRCWIFSSLNVLQSKCVTALWMYCKYNAYMMVFHPLRSLLLAAWCQAECKPRVHKSESSISCQFMRRLWIIKLWHAGTCNNGVGVGRYDAFICMCWHCSDITLMDLLDKCAYRVTWDHAKFCLFIHLLVFVRACSCMCEREWVCFYGCVFYTSTICPSNILEWDGDIWLHYKHKHTQTKTHTHTHTEEMYSMHSMTTEVSTVIFFPPQRIKVNNCVMQVNAVMTNAKLNIPTVCKLTLYMEYIYLERIRLYVYSKEPKRGVQTKSAISFRKYSTFQQTTPRWLHANNKQWANS